MQDVKPETNIAVAEFNGAVMLGCLAAGFIPGAVTAGIACAANAAAAFRAGSDDITVLRAIPARSWDDYRPGDFLNCKI